jgi:hypothetical protein
MHSRPGPSTWTLRLRTQIETKEVSPIWTGVIDMFARGPYNYIFALNDGSWSA